MLGREALIERLEAKAGREERLERASAEQQLTRAEAAGICDHHMRPPVATTTGSQLHPNARVRERCRWLPQQRTRHAQVLRQVNVILEAPHEVLATPSQALDAPPLERSHELRRSQRA